MISTYATGAQYVCHRLIDPREHVSGRRCLGRKYCCVLEQNSIGVGASDINAHSQHCQGSMLVLFCYINLITTQPWSPSMQPTITH